MMTAQCCGGGTSRHWLRPSLRSGLGFVGGELGSGEPHDKSRRLKGPNMARGGVNSLFKNLQIN